MTQRRRKRRSRFGRRAFLAGAGCAALAGAGLMLRRGQTVSALSVPAPEAIWNGPGWTFPRKKPSGPGRRP